MPLPAETPKRSAAPADVKPRRLRSPAAADPPTTPRDERATLASPAVKEEPGLERVRDDSPAPCRGETTPPAVSCQGPRAEAESEAERRSEATPTPADEPGGAGRVKMEEAAHLSCLAPCPMPAADPETRPLLREGAASPAGLTYRPSSCSTQPQTPVDPASPEPEDAEAGLDPDPPAEETSQVPEPARRTPSPPPYGLTHPSVMDVALDDPMAGMIALVAASELPQACLPQVVAWLPLEGGGLEGMTLLGEVAELELERQRSVLLRKWPPGSVWGVD